MVRSADESVVASIREMTRVKEYEQQQENKDRVRCLSTVAKNFSPEKQRGSPKSFVAASM
jgi:hypothetical protein